MSILGALEFTVTSLALNRKKSEPALPGSGVYTNTPVAGLTVTVPLLGSVVIA